MPHHQGDGSGLAFKQVSPVLSNFLHKYDIWRKYDMMNFVARK